MITATLLNLILVPVIYAWTMRVRDSSEASVEQA